VVVIFVVGFVVMMAALAAAFVGLVARRARRDRERRRGWATLAMHLGLRYEQGDPLGLGDRLGVTRVSETLWGTLRGARVAAITASTFQPSGNAPSGVGPTLETFSAVAAFVDPPARIEADTVQEWLGADAAAVRVTAAPAGDMVLLQVARTGWGSLHQPDDAATVERLLRQAAWVASRSTP
jgi:hypothetical protein